jgi:hypothetical protein
VAAGCSSHWLKLVPIDAIARRPAVNSAQMPCLVCDLSDWLPIRGGGGQTPRRVRVTWILRVVCQEFLIEPEDTIGRWQFMTNTSVTS